jgi:ATP-dependent Clp protease ATP-binding subunit ClpB
VILDVVKRSLRPELFNRIGQVVTFNSLTERELESIVMKNFNQIRKKLAEDREIGLEMTPEALAYIAKESYDPAYGARPVQRTMQQLVLSPLAGIILSGEVVSGQTIRIDYDPGVEKVVEGAEGAEPVTVREGEGLTFGIVGAE